MKVTTKLIIFIVTSLFGQRESIKNTWIETEPELLRISCNSLCPIVPQWQHTVLSLCQWVVFRLWSAILCFIAFHYGRTICVAIWMYALPLPYGNAPNLYFCFQLNFSGQSIKPHVTVFQIFLSTCVKPLPPNSHQAWHYLSGRQQRRW